MSIEGASLLRLMTWLSPAFPVGAFSYSHGLEVAIRDGAVSSEDDLYDWLGDLVTRGSAWNDAVLLAEAWRSSGDEARLTEVAELGTALASCHERQRETLQQGTAFKIAAVAWTGDDEATEVPYPVAVGAAAARLAIGLGESVSAYLHAFTGNLISAAIRLGAVGQKQGVRIQERLEAVILATAERAIHSTLDDIGGACFASELAAMRHETLEPRLFRS